MTKISVILPIYNVENYLAKCIDSVINQTLKDIEIILATDGPETCDRICDEYAAKDSRIKIISHPEVTEKLATSYADSLRRIYRIC